MHAQGLAAQAAVLGCKAVIAVLLLAAGGAKLADLRAFASAVRLFLPSDAPSALPRVLAGLVAGSELAVGAASLALPGVSWLNLVAVGICTCFLAVAATGYARHRGKPCRCFGGLSRGGFGAAGVGRAAGLVLAALVALAQVPRPAIGLSGAAELGLLACGALVAAGAFSAAAAMAGTARVETGWTGWA